ncbi:MAG: hypothetical protein HW403_256 [Dehalococcoidia bacterium]|nr:hypothetical protein [Dehalococcoidia bacterium]
MLEYANIVSYVGLPAYPQSSLSKAEGNIMLGRIWFWILPVIDLLFAVFALVPIQHPPLSLRVLIFLVVLALTWFVAWLPELGKTWLPLLAGMNRKQIAVSVVMGLLALLASGSIGWAMASTNTAGHSNHKDTKAQDINQLEGKPLAPQNQDQTQATSSNISGSALPPTPTPVPDIPECLEPPIQQDLVVACHTLQFGKNPHDEFGYQWDRYMRARPEDVPYMLERPQYIDAMTELNQVRGYGKELKPGKPLFYILPPDRKLTNPVGSGLQPHEEVVAKYFDAQARSIRSRNSKALGEAEALLTPNVDQDTTRLIAEKLAPGRCKGLTDFESKPLVVSTKSDRIIFNVWVLFYIKATCLDFGKTVEDVDWVFATARVSLRDGVYKIEGIRLVRHDDIKGRTR